MLKSVKLIDFRASTNLTQFLIHEIGRDIVTGKYSKQKKLPTEKELCDRYGASRIVIREAIKYLASKKMVFSRTSQGTWIHPETEWNLFDDDVLLWLSESGFSDGLLKELFQFRASIEPSAAAMASLGANSNDLKVIEDCLSKMLRAHAQQQETLESVVDYHLAVLNATRNRFYKQFATCLIVTIQLMHERLGVEKFTARIDTKLYSTVTKSIIKKNPSEAKNAMQFLTSPKTYQGL